MGVKKISCVGTERAAGSTQELPDTDLLPLKKPPIFPCTLAGTLVVSSICMFLVPHDHLVPSLQFSSTHHQALHWGMAVKGWGHSSPPLLQLTEETHQNKESCSAFSFFPSFFQQCLVSEEDLRLLAWIPHELENLTWTPFNHSIEVTFWIFAFSHIQKRFSLLLSASKTRSRCEESISLHCR